MSAFHAPIAAVRSDICAITLRGSPGSHTSTVQRSGSKAKSRAPAALSSSAAAMNPEVSGRSRATFPKRAARRSKVTIRVNGLRSIVGST